MNDQNIDLLSNFNDNLIQESAQRYYELLDTKLKIKLLDTKDNNKEVLITISFPKERFVHSTGLEHLPSIKRRLNGFSHNKRNIKNKIFEDALNGRFALSKLSDADKQALFSPIDVSYCPVTKGKYTIADRIKLFSDLEKNIEFGFNDENIARFFTWQPSCKFFIPGEKYPRDSHIQADYLLVLQSQADPNEKINVFSVCSDKTSNKNTSEINLEANSIFLDGVNFSFGLSKRYFTIETKKISPNIRSNLNNVSNPNTTEYMTMDSNRIPSNIINQGGEGVIHINHQLINGQAGFPFFGKIKQFFTDKAAQLSDSILKMKLSKIEKQLEKREDQLSDALNEIEDNKQLLAEKDNLISEKDKQIEDLTAENTRLEKENAQLEETVAKLSGGIQTLKNQKQPVLTAAKSPISFSDGLRILEKGTNSPNAAKPQQLGTPDISPKNKPKH